MMGLCQRRRIEASRAFVLVHQWLLEEMAGRVSMRACSCQPSLVAPSKLSSARGASRYFSGHRGLFALFTTQAASLLGTLQAASILPNFGLLAHASHQYLFIILTE